MFLGDVLQSCFLFVLSHTMLRVHADARVIDISIAKANALNRIVLIMIKCLIIILIMNTRHKYKANNLLPQGYYDSLIRISTFLTAIVFEILTFNIKKGP